MPIGDLYYIIVNQLNKFRKQIMLVLWKKMILKLVLKNQFYAPGLFFR